MSADQYRDKRISWLIGATALNTALGLGAIGLWFFAPNRGHVTSPAGSAVPTPAGVRPSFPRIERFPERYPGQTAQLPSPLEKTSSAPPSVGFDPRGLSKRGNSKVSPSTQALADRLHLDPQPLVQTFGDESGELPTDVAKRLEHAFDSATSLAKDRQLDESQSQSITAILTYYEFSVLREEKTAAPNPVDPMRIEQIREQMLTDIQITCGEDTRHASEREIERW